MNLERPTFKDILAARQIISRCLPKTPLYNYPQLDQLLDAKVYVKHENHMPTGAFKARGRINFISHLTSEQRERGVVTASTGNHSIHRLCLRSSWRAGKDRHAGRRKSCQSESREGLRRRHHFSRKDF